MFFPLGEPRLLGASAISTFYKRPNSSFFAQRSRQIQQKAYRRGAEEPRIAEKSNCRTSLYLWKSAPRAALYQEKTRPFHRPGLRLDATVETRSLRISGTPCARFPQAPAFWLPLDRRDEKMASTISFKSQTKEIPVPKPQSAPRVAAIVGPYMSGKTTLLESLLFAANAIPRKGTVK